MRKCSVLVPLVVAQLLVAAGASASDVVEVLPLTDRILMLHFDDGAVQIHKLGQPNAADLAVVDPLDETAAAASSSYSITSDDDANFAGGAAPVSVSRKSKGTEWASACQKWDPSYGCVNTDAPDMAKEHWIYLQLASPLKRGSNYTVGTGTLAKNGNSFKLSYDENTARSEAVHVNQIGYAPAAPKKFGYVYHWMGDGGGLDLAAYDGKPCRIVDQANGDTVLTSALTFRAKKDNLETYQGGTPNGNFAGADIYECDFSSLAVPGEYVLAVDGIGHSFPFRVNADVFREPFYFAMKGIFLNRSGIAYDEKVADGYARPAPHHPGVTPGFDGKLIYTTTRLYDVTNSDSSADDKALWEAGFKGPIDTWGWYQDAGDWDAYPSHSRIPSMLLFLYETAPEKFVDGELSIPESGNGLPDLLDEARWLIRFYHRTRHAIMDAGYGTGGVGGARVMGDLWGGETSKDANGNEVTKASWTDTDRTWIVSGEDVWTTFRYAALAAQLAFNLNKLGKPDPEGIDWANEAKEAYAWAQAHVTPADLVKKFDFDLLHYRMYASASLYRLTGDSTYHDTFKQDYPSAKFGDKTLPDQADWEAKVDDETRYAAFMYMSLGADRPTDAAIHAKLAAAFANVVQEQMEFSEKRGARWGGSPWFPMLVGQGTTPGIETTIIALHLLAAEAPTLVEKWKWAFYTTADYFLGNNPLNTTWAVKLGERSPTGVFRIDNWFMSKPGPAPGYIPYGPWATDKTSFWPLGSCSANWVLDKYVPRTYPRISNDANGIVNEWPGHEQWWNLRTAPLTAENTIHQTNCPSAVVFGALVGDTYVDWHGSGATGAGSSSGSTAGSGFDTGAGGASGGSGGGGGAAGAGGASDHAAGCGCRAAAGSDGGVPALGLILGLLGLSRRARRPVNRPVSSRPCSR
jgi:uncharacterized membrane protein YgcG